MDNKKIGMIILELDYNGDLTIHLSESSRHRYPDMTHYTQYINYHVGLLQEFKASVMTQMPFFTEESANEEHTEFVQTLEALAEMTQYSEAMNEKGQWLISRVVSTYSQLMPALPRDLLWFFGGDCLHYMPDEEIIFYQQLDELRFAAEEADTPFDYAGAKDSLSKAH